MVLTTGGNFGLNGSPSFKFDSQGGGKFVFGSTDNSFGQMQIGNTTSGGEAGIAFISGVTAFGGTPTSTNGDQYVWAVGANVYGIGGNNWGIANKSAGNYVAKIAYNSTSWTFSSDLRLKDVVGNISGSLEKICNLRPIEYTLKTDKSKDLKSGLIAQEVYDILPQVVDKPDTELDAKGKTRYWGIQYGDLIPYLIDAIKELNNKIESK